MRAALRGASIATWVFAAGAATAQGLPDSFSGPEPAAAEAETFMLLEAAPPPQQRLSLGPSRAEAGAVETSYLAFAWSHRQAGEAATRTLQLQSDGPKRVTTPAGTRSGLSDLLATATWELPLGRANGASGGIGLLWPAKGSVGGREAALLMSAGANRLLSPSAGTLSLGLLALQFADDPAPGLAPTLSRAELRWTVRVQPVTVALGMAKVRQAGARSVDESQAALQAPLASGEWRLRFVHQQIDGAASRRTTGLAYVIKL